MSRVEGVLRAVDDYANPMVVKELRQAVQSRLVIAVLMLSLLINILITSSFLASSNDFQLNRPAGQDLYQALFGFLVVTCMIFVPLYTAIRMSMERNHSNIDLLFITTLAPGSIIRGKFWAAVALTGLIYSACMPFLSFTYLLRGIDLPSIFCSLGFAFLCTVYTIMLAVFVGSVSGGAILRILLGLGLVYTGGLMIASTLGMGIYIVHQGVGSLFGTTGAITGVCVVLVSGLAGIILFYLLGVAAISAKSSNRMYPIRIFVSCCWLIWGIGSAIWSWIDGSGVPMMVWMFGSVIGLCIVLALILCEREHWSPRVRRHIPRSLAGRFVAWLLYTGSAGGVLWSLLLAGSTLAAASWYHHHYASQFGRTDFEESRQGLGIALMYTWCYALSGVFLRRWLAPRSSPVLSTVLGLVLLGLAGTIPLFIAYTMLGLRVRMHELPLPFIIANPFVMGDSLIDKGPVLTFLGCWSVLMLLLNIRWFRNQWNEFQRYEPATPADALTVTPLSS